MAFKSATVKSYPLSAQCRAVFVSCKVGNSCGGDEHVVVRALVSEALQNQEVIKQHY
jgi:hypothetical protein